MKNTMIDLHVENCSDLLDYHIFPSFPLHKPPTQNALHEEYDAGNSEMESPHSNIRKTTPHEHKEDRNNGI